MEYDAEVKSPSNEQGSNVVPIISSSKSGNGTFISPINEANVKANTAFEKAPEKSKYNSVSRKRLQCQKLLLQGEVTSQLRTPKWPWSDDSTLIQYRAAKRGRVVDPADSYSLTLQIH